MALTSRSARAARRSIPAKKPAGNNRYRSPGREWKVPALRLQGVFPVISWAFYIVCGLAALAGVSFCLLYGYRYLTISPYFAVKSIEVQGNFRLSSREILDIIDLEEGKNAFLLSIDDMERRLLENPWVRTASVQRRLPDGFVVRVTEKEPKFFVVRGGIPHYADIHGNPIAAVVPGAFASLHGLEVDSGAEDMLSSLPVMMQAFVDAPLPIDRSALSLIRLSAGRGVEIFMENSRLAISIGPEEWKANLDRLAVTLADLIRRGELAQVREIQAHGTSVWVTKDRPAAPPQFR